RTYSARFNDFALEFYSFVADNYAPFYSRPIECTDRDAPFVLDGVLYHESDPTSKSTTPTPTATPNSTSRPSGWSACGSARASAACTASGSTAPTRPGHAPPLDSTRMVSVP
ncbi:MAG: Tn3 family transposase, partial [Acidobacteria bacterium]|nr:Tn3 family transposase [Acidobacteriota bacterium]